MATITLANQTLNESLSIGDIVYHAPITTANGFDKFSQAPTKIGDVTGVNRSTSVVTVTTSLSGVDLVGNFLFFSKNNAVETSGIKGYYATVKMKNTSVHASELYAVNSEVAKSSK